MESSDANHVPNKFEKIVDILIRLGVLFFLITWCFDILNPFKLIIIWAFVIAIAIYPVYLSFVKILYGKRIITIVLLIVLMLSVIIVPSFLVTKSLFEGVNHIRDAYEKGEHLIPPPGKNTANWPVFTKPILGVWQSASDNLQETVLLYSKELTAVGRWLLAAFADIGKGIFQFNVSIIIAGLFLAYSKSLKKVSRQVFTKLAGENGETYSLLTAMTIRNVVKGFMGVALIQTTMASLGFFIAGVPFAGLWTVICLVLAIIQVGMGIIVIPLAIYMFSITDTTTASILAVWLGITLMADNILKPILLGTNNPVPMPVVFLGAIGGFIYQGFIGLFLGSVILTIGYKLFIAWVHTKNQV
ncbi:putative inner membrane protein [compost metagenome]